jgi:hypothetical protein
LEASPQGVGHAKARRATLAPPVVSQMARRCPDVVWPGRAMLELREVVCAWTLCGRVFCLCPSCDRGQRYCRDECREAARASDCRRARQKYARSTSGQRNNRERQRRWRVRQAERFRNGSLFTGDVRCGEISPCLAPAKPPVPTQPPEPAKVWLEAPVTPESAPTVGWDDPPTEITRKHPSVGHEQAQAADMPCRASLARGMAARVECRADAGPRPSEERRCHICGRSGRVAWRITVRGRFRQREGWP